MLSAEELSGNNQYHCEFCGGKVDATRQLCLRQLPPYLCLSLQRFVFDMKVQMCDHPLQACKPEVEPLAGTSCILNCFEE